MKRIAREFLHMDKPLIIIYSPASGSLRKARSKTVKYYDVWERIEVQASAVEVREAGTRQTEIKIKEGDRLAIEIWPGMSEHEVRAAWTKCKRLLKGRKHHLGRYAAFDRGRKYWERRYIGGKNLILLEEIPEKIERVSWNALANALATGERTRANPISPERIRQDVKKFKDLLPQYMPDKVDLVNAIEGQLKNARKD